MGNIPTGDSIEQHPDLLGFANLGGRIRPKSREMDWQQAMQLEHERAAFVYQRLSTTEQIRHSLYSLQMQDALEDLAIEDGYTVEFGPDERKRFREAEDYRGWYRNGQIIVEQRDLGISGTKGREQRPGLEHLVALIEARKVESVYVVHVSRLYRDQTLINAFSFGELCKKYDVKLITPYLRLNLRIPMHMEWYRREADWAAKELENIISRLHGARNVKARQGRYAGAGIPPGYIIDTRRTVTVDGCEVDNPNFEKLRVYEPHARVIRYIMEQLTRPNANLSQIVRDCHSLGIRFEPFPAEVAQIRANLKAFSRSKPDLDGGWSVTRSYVQNIATNPAYIGWWIWAGELVSTNNHPPIIDEETFQAVQSNLKHRTGRPKKDTQPMPLAGLVWCGNHDELRKMTYSRHQTARYSQYRCQDNAKCGAVCAISSHLIDDAVADFVLSQFSRPELAEAVLTRLERDYERAHDRARSLRREVARLDEEIETLEHNYRVIKLTPERAEKLAAEIDSLMAEKRRLSEVDAYPAGKVVEAFSQAEVDRVRAMLRDLRQIWPNQSDDLKNAFFRLILQRVILRREASFVRAVIQWKSDEQHEIEIRRPWKDTRRRWTSEEDAILRALYGQEPGILMEHLPGHNWGGIMRRASTLGIAVGARTGGRSHRGKSQRRWSAEEDEVVRRVSSNELYIGEAAVLLGRTQDSIHYRLRELGLRREKPVQWRLIEKPEIEKDAGSFS